MWVSRRATAFLGFGWTFWALDGYCGAIGYGFKTNFSPNNLFTSHYSNTSTYLPRCAPSYLLQAQWSIEQTWDRKGAYVWIVGNTRQEALKTE